MQAVWVEGKWRYNGGRGEHAREREKKGKRRNKSSQRHQKKVTVGTVE